MKLTLAIPGVTTSPPSALIARIIEVRLEIDKIVFLHRLLCPFFCVGTIGINTSWCDHSSLFNCLTAHVMAGNSKAIHSRYMYYLCHDCTVYLTRDTATKSFVLGQGNCVAESIPSGWKLNKWQRFKSICHKAIEKCLFDCHDANVRIFKSPWPLKMWYHH